MHSVVIRQQESYAAARKPSYRVMPCVIYSTPITLGISWWSTWSRSVLLCYPEMKTLD